MSAPYPTDHIEEWLRPATEPGLPYSNTVAYVPTAWQRRVWSALFEFAGAQSNVYLSDYYQRDGSIRVQIPPRQTRQIARIEKLLEEAGIQFHALPLRRTSWIGDMYTELVLRDPKSVEPATTGVFRQEDIQ
jgi:hypothetical protein